MTIIKMKELLIKKKHSSQGQDNEKFSIIKT